jgi:hypothetical protein
MLYDQLLAQERTHKALAAPRDVGALLNQKLSTEIKKLSVRASHRKSSRRRGPSQRRSGASASLPAIAATTTTEASAPSSLPPAEQRSLGLGSSSPPLSPQPADKQVQLQAAGADVGLVPNTRFSMSRDSRLRLPSVSRRNPLFEASEALEGESATDGDPAAAATAAAPTVSVAASTPAAQVSEPAQASAKGRFAESSTDDAEPAPSPSNIPASAAVTASSVKEGNSGKTDRAATDAAADAQADEAREGDTQAEEQQDSEHGDDTDSQDGEPDEDIVAPQTGSFLLLTDSEPSTTQPSPSLTTQGAPHSRWSSASLGLGDTRLAMLVEDSSTDSPAQPLSPTLPSATSAASQGSKDVTPASGAAATATAATATATPAPAPTTPPPPPPPLAQPTSDLVAKHGKDMSVTKSGSPTTSTADSKAQPPSVASPAINPAPATKIAPAVAPKPQSAPASTQASRAALLEPIAVTTGSDTKRSRIYQALNPTALAADAQVTGKRMVSGVRVGQRAYAEANMVMMVDHPDAGEDSDDAEADALAAAEADAALAEAFARARAAAGLPPVDTAAALEPQAIEVVDMDNLPDFGDELEHLVRLRSEREIVALNRQAELRRKHEEERAAQAAVLNAELARIEALQEAERAALQAAKAAQVTDALRRLEELQFNFSWSSNC